MACLHKKHSGGTFLYFAGAGKLFQMQENKEHMPVNTSNYGHTFCPKYPGQTHPGFLLVMGKQNLCEMCIFNRLPFHWGLFWFILFLAQLWTYHYEGLHTGKNLSFEWSFQWKITSSFFFCTCVRKLESRMLITITNSNSNPEVNSSEVSLKLQCEVCVCTQKHPKHLLGGGAYLTFVLVRTCVYIYKLVPLENSHS